MSEQVYDHESDNAVFVPVEHTTPKAEKDEVASYRVIRVNPLDSPYKSFVYSTWLNSLRSGNDMYKLIDSDAYYANYSKYINHLLVRPNVILNVAVLSDDQDVALGWSLHEKNKLHYVFVKKDFRKIGIAKSLVHPDINTITHITTIGLSIWQNKLPNVKFNPF